MRRRFAEIGLVAIAQKAWGQDFEVLVSGAGAAPYEMAGAFAVVSINGPLMQHANFFFDSYDGIRERVAAALASEAQAVCLRIDSPGGEAAGCFELARELRAMSKAAGKRLVAFTDSMAASAAYALATAAEFIAVTPTATVGSIGCFEVRLDQTVLDQSMGLRFVFAASGNEKLDRNPHVAITEGATVRIQASVDELAGLFYELVAEHRGVTPAKVAALDGGTFFGAKAVGMGLADQVFTWTALIAGSGYVGSDSTRGGEAMAEEDKDKDSYADLMGRLRSRAEGEDDDAEKAKSALRAIDDAEEKEKKAASKAEGDGDEPGDKDKDKEAKAKAEDKEKEAKASAAAVAAKAAAEGAGAVALAERLHVLEVERAERLASEARNVLLAKRPDFSPEVVATLSAAPIEVLRKAVETWPKGPARAASTAAAAAATATGTRGDSQTGEGGSGETAPRTPPTEAEIIARKMGQGVRASGTSSSTRKLELGFMTPEQASKRLDELTKVGA